LTGTGLGAVSYCVVLGVILCAELDGGDGFGEFAWCLTL
jgi:hypothetical protein